MGMARGDPEAHPVAFAASPDGTTIATAGAEGRVALRRSADGWSLRRSLGDRGLVWAIAFAPTADPWPWREMSPTSRCATSVAREPDAP